MRKFLVCLLTLLCLLTLPAAALANNCTATPVAQDIVTHDDGDTLRYTSYEGKQVVQWPVTLCFEQENGDVTEITVVPKMGEITYFFAVVQEINAEGQVLDRFSGGVIDAFRGVYPALTVYDNPLLEVTLTHNEPPVTGMIECFSGDPPRFMSSQTGGFFVLTYNNVLRFNRHGELIGKEQASVSIVYAYEYEGYITDPEYTGELVLPTYDEWMAAKE